MHADTSRLTGLGFLTHRTIAATVLIDDDDIGPVEATVAVDAGTNTATLGLDEDDVLRQESFDGLLSWTINRGYVREKVLERFAGMKLARKPTDLGHGLFALGTSEIGGVERPVYLWEGHGDIANLEKVDRILREQRDAISGLVLTPASRPISFLGKHLLLEIATILQGEDAMFSRDRLDDLWREGHAPAAAGDGADLDIYGESAVLRIPGQDPLTIVGADRVELVRKLLDAWRQGRTDGGQTGELVRHTGSSGPEAVMGPEWKPCIKDRYIYSPRRKFWALKIPPT
jgi:hypothetical protein